MTDLLTPEKVREWQRVNGSLKGGAWFNETIDRLCRDYLTLWDRNKELEKPEVCSVCGGKGEAQG